MYSLGISRIRGPGDTEGKHPSPALPKCQGPPERSNFVSQAEPNGRRAENSLSSRYTLDPNPSTLIPKLHVNSLQYLARVRARTRQQVPISLARSLIA